MSQKLPDYLTVSSNISNDLQQQLAVIEPDKVAILVDENTRQSCLPRIDVPGAHIIEIKSGEVNKTLDTCTHIWRELTNQSFSRNSLLINLGGGVIGDMGGFAAATYKRGIPFINIPTTLLSQVDASIGGKLAVDFEGLKNHIGVFKDPAAVLVYPDFIDTLEERELKSGYAEVLKHALIFDVGHWHYLKSLEWNQIGWQEIIPKSIAIKNNVVKQDPLEKGLRKILNYGHTLGHALETHYLHSKDRLLHGEAIALGMILENELSLKHELLSKEDTEEISAVIRSVYGNDFTLPSFEELKPHLLQDKKNIDNAIRFSLLDAIGSCQYDVIIQPDEIQQVLTEAK